MRIALATCRVLPEPDPDRDLLLEAFGREGIDARWLPWDDPLAPFDDHDAVLIRSTWNYWEHVDEFLAWTERLGRVTKVSNDPSTIRWNAIKSYLTDLGERGVKIVPTEIVRRGERRALSAILDDRGWSDIVVKPLVSAGSFRTARFSSDHLEAARRFFDDLVAERDVLVQEHMAAVETSGERSLVVVDGEVTHAVRKSPRFAGQAENVSAAVPIAADERAFAEDVLARAPVQPPLYARVDMVRDREGALRLMELELVEPSLFFRQCSTSLDRFVRAVRDRHRPGGKS